MHSLIMLLRTGTDIIEIARIRNAIQRRGRAFLDRLFTAIEQSYCEEHIVDPAMRYAGRFAAKEAVAKALGTGIGSVIGWLDIEIATRDNGEPYSRLSRKVENSVGSFQMALSISHCREYATATVIAMRDDT